MNALLKTEGIVLKNIRYGDHAFIVTMYTRELGIKSFWFRRKMGKNPVKALLAPLSQLQMVTNIRKDEKILTPVEISLVLQYRTLYQDPVKSSMVLFLAEWLQKVLKEEEANHHLYQFIADSLLEIDRQEHLHPSFHLSFLFHLTRFLGFLPDRSHYQTGDCFDPEAGIFKPADLHQPLCIASDISRWFYELSGIPVDQYQLFKTDRQTRNLLLDVLIRYYTIHLPGFGEVKSLPVIRVLFS